MKTRDGPGLPAVSGRTGTETEQLPLCIYTAAPLVDLLPAVSSAGGTAVQYGFYCGFFGGIYRQDRVRVLFGNHISQIG